MEEIYKDIEGYEGLYQVSNLGNVKSLKDNNGKYREKILKPSIRKGYLKVNLCKNKTIKNYSVHRLVAIAFITNTHNFPCINHKDENKKNNVVSNLEWCSYKYNLEYNNGQKRRGKANSKSLTNNPKISKPVGAFKNGELIMTFPSTKEASRNGFNQGHVASCCRSERKSHKGYEWRYL